MGGNKPIWVTGFMSGTSLDGVDAACLLTRWGGYLRIRPQCLSALQRSGAPDVTKRAGKMARRARAGAGIEVDLGGASGGSGASASRRS